MSNRSITRITAREIIDCRGWQTVQADVWVDGRLAGRAEVPAGRTPGINEAHVLLDGDPKRYRGRGVLRAVANVEQVIAPALEGMDVTDQRKIDLTMIELDGTPDKSKFGPNAILGVSLAAARAAASETAGLEQVVIAGIDSDSTDGPTRKMAGGLVDGHTLGAPETPASTSPPV